MNRKLAVKMLVSSLRKRDFETAKRTIRMTLGIQKSNLDPRWQPKFVMPGTAK